MSRQVNHDIISQSQVKDKCTNIWKQRRAITNKKQMVPKCKIMFSAAN